MPIPDFVKDKAKWERSWERAKKLVKKQYGNVDDHYGAVMEITKNIYKNSSTEAPVNAQPDQDDDQVYLTWVKTTFFNALNDLSELGDYLLSVDSPDQVEFDDAARFIGRLERSIGVLTICKSYANEYLNVNNAELGDGLIDAVETLSEGTGVRIEDPEE